MCKVKAIIFDWGGVLIDDPAPGLVSYCCNALGVSNDHFIEIHKKYLPKFQKGLMLESEFWEKVCNELKVPTPNYSSLLGDAFQYVYSPKKEMFDLVALLNIKGYKTALLSNTELPMMIYFNKLNYRMFDILTFSCNEKTRKPERKIYELTLNRLRVKPYEAIFIDDRIDYIEGAQQINIRTILFKSYSDTIEKLSLFSVMVDNK